MDINDHPPERHSNLLESEFFKQEQQLTPLENTAITTIGHSCQLDIDREPGFVRHTQIAVTLGVFLFHYVMPKLMSQINNLEPTENTL